MSRYLFHILLFCSYLEGTFAIVDEQKFSSKDIDKIVIESQSGETVITGDSQEDFTIKADKVVFDSEKCKLEIKKLDDELVIRSKQIDNWTTCKVNFDIITPKKIDIEIKSGSGITKIDGTKGEIIFKMGSGSIKVGEKAEIKELDGKCGSGNIEVAGKISGDVSIKQGSGDSVLVYRELPKKGDVKISVGSGNATIFLPTKSKVLTNFNSGTGRIYNEIGDTKNAKFHINMKSGSGNLKLKKLEP